MHCQDLFFSHNLWLLPGELVYILHDLRNRTLTDQEPFALAYEQADIPPNTIPTTIEALGSMLPLLRKLPRKIPRKASRIPTSDAIRSNVSVR